jgi:hypothetical protein
VGQTISTIGFHIEKRTPTLTVGICDACKEQFRSHLKIPAQAEWEIAVLFQRHKCKAQRVKVTQASSDV